MDPPSKDLENNENDFRPSYIASLTISPSLKFIDHWEADKMIQIIRVPGQKT